MLELAELRKRLRYDEKSGDFYWRHRPLEDFASPNAFHSYSRFSGKIAGSTRPDGYKLICVCGCFVYAHRLAWAFANNAWPEVEVDHIDGDPSNNRISNLRSVTFEENSHNLGIGPRNKSGVLGVHRSPSSKGWVAQIRVSKKVKHLGTFASIDEAARARADAEAKFNFHENHGRRLSRRAAKANDEEEAA